jgi:uncharacterized hydantoinase/oxoprolinase family protein
MTKEREALKLALDWLESGDFVYPGELRTAIKAALAQPSQEPEPDELTIVYMSGLNDGKKAEREACAKIARKVANATRPDDFALDKCYEIENAIQARGNT